ncbi:Aspartic peptidase A1 family protein [Dioscorea alata]|uniref:Aspartic peptidase A1 family protein n=1 Tax=Dioscorea alata TaxID=55571 RepID=A0ACB7WM56_DIOAL|nr:Aspartic peptidase A1 family protein [Dioscorea alata]
MASHFFAFLFLCFSLLIQYTYVAGKISGRLEHTIAVSSLLPDTICSTTKDFTPNNRLKLTHRHGPCSPIKNSKKPDHKQILAHDQSRVDSIQHRRHHSSTTTTKIEPNKIHQSPLAGTKIPAHTGKSFSTANFIVTVGFGTPKRDLSLIFDTGSDVTWIQCQPCVSSCYAQQEPIFEPTQSSTYSNVSCSESACSELDTSSCSGTTCLYAVQYGDNSYTVGFYSKDTLTLSSSDILPGFFFGCGEKNKGLFGKAAGLLGLGRGSTSLISQSKTKYNGVFSYCLPSTSSSVGYLTFGGGAPANIKYTSMLTDSSMPTFYFLNLQSIRVAGIKLSISPTVFSNAGTLIDSGTVISRLPPAAYSSLRQAFKQKMGKYPTAPALSILDTCYDFSNYSTVSVPTVALEFAGGVVVDLDFSGILYVASLSQACLAFAGNGDAGDVGIFGNIQQHKLNVVYNVGKQVIGFGKGGCT